MFSKNKYKAMAMIASLAPMALASTFVANQQTTNLVETVQVKTPINKVSKVSTFSEFKENNNTVISTKENVSEKAVANNKQNNFIITVSVLGGVFLSLMVLFITIIVKFKNIKKNEEEENNHN
jgi:hypothetical protein